MLSFGYTEIEIVDNSRIGRYGNGFKSGSIRIGKDVVVFTITKTTWCIGLLSQTFHEKEKMEDIYVPIVAIDKETKMFEKCGREDLKVLLKYSPFASKADIIKEFEDIQANYETGTRIIIFNLVKGQLDFNTDKTDIINCDSSKKDPKKNSEKISQHLRSLRAYCSILYLQKNTSAGYIKRCEMKIYLRNELVHQKKTKLKRTNIVKYTHKRKAISVYITFGFVPLGKTDYGMKLYHKNRLIKYQKVGCQTNKYRSGKGVVGIVDVTDLLVPIHNKQDFDRTKIYRTVMKAFAAKLTKYWNSKKPTVTAKDVHPDRKQVTKRVQSTLPYSKLPREKMQSVQLDSDVEPGSPVPGPSNEVIQILSESPLHETSTQYISPVSPVPGTSTESRVLGRSRRAVTQQKHERNTTKHGLKGTGNRSPKKPRPSSTLKSRSHLAEASSPAAVKALIEARRMMSDDDDIGQVSLQTNKVIKSKRATAEKLKMLRKNVRKHLKHDHPKSLQDWPIRIDDDNLEVIDDVLDKLVHDRQQPTT